MSEIVRLWLALRHGLVTMRLGSVIASSVLWLALRHGLVTINDDLGAFTVELWLALRHGLVTIHLFQVFARQALAPKTAQNNSS